MPILMPAAILGAGALGAGASLIAGGRQASAAREAAVMQAAMQQRGLDFQREVFDTNQANIRPFINIGSSALGQVGSFYGLDGTTPLGQASLDRFRQSPDYQFAQQEGMRGLENSAAARGGLLSGNFLRGAQQFGQGLATQNLQNYLGRLLNMGQMGQNAAVGAGGLAQQGANSISNLYSGMGQTMAGGVTGAANANAAGLVGGANSINSAVQNYLFMNAMNNRSSYGGGVNSGYLPMSGNPYNYTGSLY